MNTVAKYVAIVAAIGVLFVLITPAFDELPCTAGHRPHLTTVLVGSLAALLPEPVSAVHVALTYVAASRSTDLLSFTCTLLC